MAGTIFKISGLVIGLTYTVLALTILKYGSLKSRYIWAFFNSMVSIWGYGCFFIASSENSREALFFWKIALIGAIFAPSVFYHVTVVLGEVPRRRVLILFYAYACIFWLLSALNLAGVRPEYVFGSFYYLRAYDFRWITLLTGWYFLIFYALFELYKIYHKARGDKRIQFFYLLIGCVVGFTGALLDTLPFFGFYIFPFHFANILIWIYCLVVAYAILRHKLLDIEVVVKKTLVFTSLFAIVLGMFIGITLLTQELIAGGRLLGLAVSSIIIIVAVRPLEDVLIGITDKYLFQKKYDYKQVLKSFIDEVITVLNLDKIIESTVELLEKTLRPDKCAILLLNRYEDKYVSYKTRGHEGALTLDNGSKIVNLLKTTRDIFFTESREKDALIPEGLRQEMGNLRMRLAIPLLLHNDLIGMMLLGKKKSDEEYTREDLDIMTDLARTEAVAIGNAQLFAETAQNERRAAIGTLAAGINHEVGNPLNIINTKMQVYLMALERDAFKEKDAQEVINESKAIMKVCLEQTARISDITRKLSNFARPSREFRPEVTDIRREIDETLSVVGHELELERIEIKKNIEKSLPNILADKRQIQQIFFNIIKNAAQSIEEKGAIEIKAYSSMEGNARNVKVEISDTGRGIPEEKLDKIYDPFYTTKAPSKGTGLGLSIVRQLVWRNKGDITVKSKLGAGTTFILSFPEGRVL